MHCRKQNNTHDGRSWAALGMGKGSFFGGNQQLLLDRYWLRSFLFSVTDFYRGLQVNLIISLQMKKYAEKLWMAGILLGIATLHFTIHFLCIYSAFYCILAFVHIMVNKALNDNFWSKGQSILDRFYWGCNSAIRLCFICIMHSVWCQHCR